MLLLKSFKDIIEMKIEEPKSSQETIKLLNSFSDFINNIENVYLIREKILFKAYCSQIIKILIKTIKNEMNLELIAIGLKILWKSVKLSIFFLNGKEIRYFYEKLPEIILELYKAVDFFKAENKIMFNLAKLLSFSIKYEFQENESLIELKKIQFDGLLNNSKQKISESLTTKDNNDKNELVNGLLLKQNNIKDNQNKIELLLNWMDPTKETIKITESNVRQILKLKEKIDFYDYLLIYSYVHDSSKDIFLYNEKFEHLILKVLEDKISDSNKIKSIRLSLKIKSLNIVFLSIQTLKKIYNTIENLEFTNIENKCLFELLKLIKMINTYSNQNKGPKIKEIFLKKVNTQREILINSNNFDFVSYFDFFLEILEPLEFINSFLNEQKILEKFCNKIKSPKLFQKFSKKVWSFLAGDKRDMMKNSEYGKVKIFTSSMKNRAKCDEIIFFWRKEIKNINRLSSEMKDIFIFFFF